MTTTLLYYPSMVIDNPRWIRQSILYWDEIGSIVPKMFEVKDIVKKSYDMQILSDAGFYKPFRPEKLVERNEDFALEFISWVKARGYPIHDRFPSSMLENMSGIHLEKIHNNLAIELVYSKIAIQLDGKLYMNQEYVFLYMSLLAKYMANAETFTSTTPSTDRTDYLQMAYPAPDKNNFKGFSLSLNEILPTPIENVRINDILKFKEHRKDELLHFRQTIYEHQDKIKQAKEVDEVRDLNNRFAEQIQLEISNLGKAFKGDGIRFVLGTLKNILAIETPALIAAFTLQVPDPVKINLSIAGAAVAGTISLSEYLLDVRNQKNERLTQNSYTYLLQARQEGIIK